MKRDKLFWELQLVKTRAPLSYHLRGRPTLTLDVFFIRGLGNHHWSPPNWDKLLTCRYFTSFWKGTEWRTDGRIDAWLETSVTINIHISWHSICYSAGVHRRCSVSLGARCCGWLYSSSSRQPKGRRRECNLHSHNACSTEHSPW